MLSDEEINQLGIPLYRKKRLMQVREWFPTMLYKEMAEHFHVPVTSISSDILILFGDFQHTRRGRNIVNAQNARLRRMGRTEIVTYEEWVALCIQCQQRCMQCQKRDLLCMDHIIPLVRGGAHCITNIQPLCQSCNSKKGSQIPELPLDK